MVLNFESQTRCGVQTMAEEFGTWILDENYDKLDGSAVYALYDTKDCPM